MSKKQSIDINPEEPNEKQLANCQRSGWEYLGDGLFKKGDLVGFFSDRTFKKELCDDVFPVT